MTSLITLKCLKINLINNVIGFDRKDDQGVRFFKRTQKQNNCIVI